MKLLMELRPALDGHAGIPQETRLLFRTLASLPEFQLEGLIQSSNKVLPHGKRSKGSEPVDQAIDRQSRVVVALQQHDQMGIVEWLGHVWRRTAAPLRMLLVSALGGRTSLSHFSPAHFEDFLWRALFSKSLPLIDRDLVVQQAYRVVRVPWGSMHFAGLLSRRLGVAIYPRLDTRGTDVMIVETPYPGRVSRSTRMVVRYHDAIPLLMPHTIIRRGYHQASHFHALRRNVRDGAWFACVSEATRNDLLAVFPEVRDRSEVIPNMVSHQYHEENSSPRRVAEVVWARRNRRAAHGGGASVSAGDLDDGVLSYLLVVSTIEPRKNHLTILDAWERLRTGGFPHLNLVFVGSLGWEHGATMDRMAPWLERGGLHLLENVPAEDLRLLYRHAKATVCPSFSEGFDFAGVEAMCSGGVVVSSDIPVHREIYDVASLYFSPYSVPELYQCLETIVADDDAARSRRQALIQKGAEVALRYRAERIAGQWRDFLNRVAGTVAV